MTEKSVLITGGTGALGQTVVRSTVQRGHSATVVYRDEEEWERLRSALGDGATHVLPVPGDVIEAESMQRTVAAAVERFGRLDGLFHLVGGYAYAPLEETSPDLWQRLIALNLTSAYVAASAAREALSTSGGAMVFVGAQAALTFPANQAAYNAAKSGVLALAKTLATELRPAGIRVNSVVPDIIDSAANRRSMPNANSEKWLRPEQVADTLLYLLSDEASGVTGASITLQRT